MIEATELRPTNKVLDNNTNRIVSISGIYPGWNSVHVNFGNGSGMYDLQTSSIDPIPITEQWLMDFGFEIGRTDQHYGKEYFKNGIFLYFVEGDFRYYKGKTNRSWVVIEFVHELQNLFFWLSAGEELNP